MKNKMFPLIYRLKTKGNRAALFYFNNSVEEFLYLFDNFLRSLKEKRYFIICVQMYLHVIVFILMACMT